MSSAGKNETKMFSMRFDNDFSLLHFSISTRNQDTYTSSTFQFSNTIFSVIKRDFL